MPAIFRSVLPYHVLLNSSGLANESSEYIDRSAFLRHSIQFINPNGETIKVFASNDAVNWVQVGVDVIDHGLAQLDGLYPYIKVVRGATATKIVSVTIFSSNLARS